MDSTGTSTVTFSHKYNINIPANNMSATLKFTTLPLFPDFILIDFIFNFFYDYYD